MPTSLTTTQVSTIKAIVNLFETGHVLGDYGLSGGGAAGFELDRADPMLGTPDNAVILARSENPLPSFLTVPEEGHRNPKQEEP